MTQPSTATRYVFSTQPRDTKHYRFPTHVNDLVLDRADAATSEVFVVVLEEGEAPPLHKHDDTEQIFYILEGRGELTIADEPTQPVAPGEVVRIPPHTLHKIDAVGGPLKYLAVDCFLNGRPADEPTWHSHVEVMCQEQGWDIDEVSPAGAGTS